MANIIGEYGDDSIVGTSGNDNIDGSYGNDTLVGGEGNDTLNGGEGFDRLSGGPGDDVLYVGGSDSLIGGDGRDLFIPGPPASYYSYGISRILDFTQGEDRIDLSALGIPDLETARLFFTAAGDGNWQFQFRSASNLYSFYLGVAPEALRASDFIFAGPVSGGLIRGGGGPDDLIGGVGNDTLDGGSGDDSLIGGAGDDRLILRGGWDRAIGGIGNDVFVISTDISSGYASYTIADFTRGQDRIDVSAFGISSWDTLKALMTSGPPGYGTSFNLARGSQVSFFLTGVDSNLLSASDFILSTDTTPREIYGGWMSHLYGGVGNDRLHGSGNGSWMFGEGGDDILYAATGGSSRMSGGAGRDIFVLEGGTSTTYAEIVDFTQGVDRIDVSDLGISSFDVIRGLAALPSGSPQLLQLGSLGLTLNIDRQKLTAADFIFAEDSPARQISAVGTAGLLTGGSGNDTLIGGASGIDRLFGGAGDDTIMDDPTEPAGWYGAYGADVWSGGAGRDLFVVNQINGRDVVIDFTRGTDRIDLSALGISSMETVRYLAEYAGISGKAATAFRAGIGGDSGVFAFTGDRDLLSANDFILANQTSAVTRTALEGERDLFGGLAGDTLRGNGGTNRLFGDAGDDMLAGGAGDDRLYGGAGVDTALFTGKKAEYTITTINGITTVRHDTGNDGTDMLIGVERLSFADQVMTLAAADAVSLRLTGSYVQEGDRGSYPIIVEGKIISSVLAPATSPTAVFTVSLSQPATQAVTFDFSYATASGYSIGSRSYTIAAGQSGIDILLPAASGNTDVWSDYVLVGTISNVQGALVPTVGGNITARSTIVNDDFQAGFSLEAYRAQNSSLDRIFAGDDAGLIQHYINNGRSEGRIATGFDAEAYAAQNADLYAVYGLDAKALLTHYQTMGVNEARPREGFDAVAYAALNPDLYAAFGLNHRSLIEHYMNYGEKEGRLASGFDAEAYAALNPDLFRAFGLNEKALVEHFIQTGRAEGRSAVGFSAEAYAAFNGDLFAAFGLDHSALVNHYIVNGQAEKRFAYSLDGYVPAMPTDPSLLVPLTGWSQDYLLG
ncbi:M10 family metallopeptidase C-terminal domain-containing protein [Niveispirillum sp.]|uniref:M10 family metallopeptidase C-terminal domain-containing protein n=1 Tax=Niveispirillum sp. TaxID=1917217 RepID=UPI001B4B4962|nr:M10 family metallopeptidase C-terminal domain-containing protein [Niveispirillum sp.]MBP7337126.1 M10 family metallopeptidase C-terminal domain-containing protein [Niveispirillum sp.]